MIKSYQTPAVILPDTRSILKFVLRGYKYLQVVKQNPIDQNIPPSLANNFLRKVKKAKTFKLMRAKIGLPEDLCLKPRYMRSMLKACSQQIKELNISTCSEWSFGLPKNILFPLKNLHTLCLSCNAYDSNNIYGLKGLKRIKNLFINLTSSKNQCVKSDLLGRALLKLQNLDNLSLIIDSRSIDQVLMFLDEITVKIRKPIKYQLMTKGNPANDLLSKVTENTFQKITKLSVGSIDFNSLLRSSLTNSSHSVFHLRNLKLRFDNQDDFTLYYLKNLKQIPFLTKLSLCFSIECQEKKFAEGILKHLHLPDSIQSLHVTVPISIKHFMTKNMHLLEEKPKGRKKYPWRDFNLFDSEPIYSKFFQSLGQAKCLNKIEFHLHMLDPFNSHYTNFFVSILDNLSNINSFSFYVAGFERYQSEEKLPEYFDLALLLQSCSKNLNLQEIEVVMPNLLFDEATTFLPATHLDKLLSFSIGISEDNEEKPIQIQNASASITKLLQTLASIAPNLNTLILDFGELITQKMLIKRFALIGELLKLEFLSVKLFVKRCNFEATKSIGKTLMSLKRLETIVLNFFESDKRLLDLRKYINYQKSIRDASITIDQTVWISSGFKLEDIESERNQ